MARVWQSPSMAASTLPRHSISGFSSGGDMAMLHAFAFSSRVDGIGVASGAPYGCNLLPGDSCGHDAPAGPWKAELATFQRYIAERHARGAIDDPANLARTPAFLFRGTLDRLVALPVMQARAIVAQWHERPAPCTARKRGGVLTATHHRRTPSLTRRLWAPSWRSMAQRLRPSFQSLQVARSTIRD